MFGVFGFVLKLRIKQETAQNPVHCIQIEFILIGRFKWQNVVLLFIEMWWKTEVVKKKNLQKKKSYDWYVNYLELENIKKNT